VANIGIIYISTLVAARLVGQIFVVGKDGGKHSLSVATVGSKSAVLGRQTEAEMAWISMFSGENAAQTRKMLGGSNYET
jgi:hypothetical protein